MRSIAAAVLLAAAPALAATPGAAKRGDLVVHVKVTGTVVPDDVFRLKSTIEGRVEAVGASTFSWKEADEPLAMLAHRELAAMLDARGVVGETLLEDRWQGVYRPTPVRCPDQCFVLKLFVKPRQWVKPQSVLAEAARRLKLVGRVRPEDAPLIRDGMPLTFWSLKEPDRKLTGRVTHFVLDIQGERVDPGGTFTLDLGPDRYFDPGTEWAGEIVPFHKTDVLTVPTAALITFGGMTYLPVRVSTGVTTQELTQITAGLDDKREFLILDDAQLRGAPRHAQTVDHGAIEAHRRELTGDSAPPPSPAATDDGTPPPSEPKRRQPSSVDDKGYGGEDPYGE